MFFCQSASVVSTKGAAEAMPARPPQTDVLGGLGTVLWALISIGALAAGAGGGLWWWHKRRPAASGTSTSLARVIERVAS